MLGFLLGLAAVEAIAGSSASDFTGRNPSDLTPSEREIRRRQLERDRQRREEEARRHLSDGTW